MHELFEVEIEGHREQALVDRGLLYAADRVGKHVRGVVGVEVDAGIFQGLAHPAPVAGQRLLLEKTVFGRNGFAGGSQQDGNEKQHSREFSWQGPHSGTWARPAGDKRRPCCVAGSRRACSRRSSSWVRSTPTAYRSRRSASTAAARFTPNYSAFLQNSVLAWRATS